MNTPIKFGEVLGRFGLEIEMTRDEIIKAMRSVCDKDKVDAWQNDFWTITQEELERFASLVVAAEREECAKLAAWILKMPENDVSHAIRARGMK